MTEQEREIAEKVQKSCVRTFIEAYEDAGIQGLCEEGRFEVAVDAVRSMSPESLLEKVEPTVRRPSRPA